MPAVRQLSDEELEAVRLTELANPENIVPRLRAGRTHLQPQEGQVKLYCPEHEACSFGPGDSRSGPSSDRLIQFGEVEAHVAIVRADHPLLVDRVHGILRYKPGIVVLEPGETPGRTYACVDCDREFESKRALKAHVRAEHAEDDEEEKPTRGRRQQKADPSGE